VADKDALERIQKRVVNMVSGLQGKTYEERLAECGLTTLEERRRRGDMIQTWKIIHGVDNVDKKTWFTMVEGDEAIHRTRGAVNQLNIVKPKCKNDLRRNFFSVRVVEMWNSLSNRVREAKSLNSFKNLYDEWLEEKRRLQ
jgi:ribonuclease P/MRP protein subunit RPP40